MIIHKSITKYCLNIGYPVIFGCQKCLRSVRLSSGSLKVLLFQIRRIIGVSSIIRVELIIVSLAYMGSGCWIIFACLAFEG